MASATHKREGLNEFRHIKKSFRQFTALKLSRNRKPTGKNKHRRSFPCVEAI